MKGKLLIYALIAFALFGRKKQAAASVAASTPGDVLQQQADAAFWFWSPAAADKVARDIGAVGTNPVLSQPAGPDLPPGFNSGDQVPTSAFDQVGQDIGAVPTPSVSPVPIGPQNAPPDGGASQEFQF